MHTQVRGTSLHWTEQGSGPLALWAHGLATDSKALERCGLVNWSALTRSQRLIRYDARGHGRSEGQPIPEQFTWPELARDLLALAQTLQPVGRIAAVGASMGTATILHAAAIVPDRFRALVLTVPPSAWETRRARASNYRRFAEQLERGGEATATELMSQFRRPDYFSGVPDTAVSVSYGLLPSLMRGAGLSDLPDEMQLRALTVPTLILAWADDPAHPLSTAERLAEYIPGAQLHVASSLEQIRSWGHLAEAFLSSHS